MVHLRDRQRDARWKSEEGDSPVGDHIEDSSELARLTERSRCLTVEGVQEAREAIERGAVFRMIAARRISMSSRS